VRRAALPDARRARQQRGLRAGVAPLEADLLRLSQMDGLPVPQPLLKSPDRALVSYEIAGGARAVLFRPQLVFCARDEGLARAHYCRLRLAAKFSLARLFRAFEKGTRAMASRLSHLRQEPQR